MTNDRRRIEFEEGVEARQKEGLEILRKVERRCAEEAEARRREWEAAEGRAMTRAERLDHGQDALLIKIDATTRAQLAWIDKLREEAEARSAESRAREEKRYAREEKRYEESREEARAGREALLRMLDRLPPRDGE